MAKMVGLSRNIKLQWLNKVVELEQEDLTTEERKEQLNEYLSFEIGSPTVLRKTREILMNIWEYENDYSAKLREEGLSLIAKYPENRVAIHWCMLLAAYPVFVDLCKMIGKMSEFTDEITLKQIKEKIFDEWGERSTLFHSIDKIISTLKDLGVLSCDKPGRYHISKQEVNNQAVVSFMIYAIMLIDDAGYYTFQELKELVYLFPFEYQLSKEQLMEDSRFTMNNFGGELSVTLAE